MPKSKLLKLILSAAFLFNASVPLAAQSPTVSLRDFIIKRNSWNETDARKSFELFCPVGTSPLADRVFREYGAVFATSDDVKLPKTCLFYNAEMVENFQRTAKSKSVLIGGVAIELQEVAMDALIEATKEASEKRLSITPLDGAIAGKRDYQGTVRIWNSRVEPALRFWTERGKIKIADAEAARAMSVADQINAVLAWESKGLYFAANRSNSIFYSAAPPGSSQHLMMLAFDIVEYGNKNVRETLNRNGWFQTVRNDAPHFTYLGINEYQLPSRGLKLVRIGPNGYWLPNSSLSIP